MHRGNTVVHHARKRQRQGSGCRASVGEARFPREGTSTAVRQTRGQVGHLKLARLRIASERLFETRDNSKPDYRPAG